MSAAPDPRRHAWRADLADAALRGLVSAPRYAEGEACKIIAPIAPLFAAPDAGAMRQTEALSGEGFTVFDRARGWCWGQSAVDGYVGYVAEDCLGPAGPEPGHYVAVPQAHVFSRPDIKSAPLARLPMLARLALAGFEGDFAVLIGGGYMIARHLRPMGESADDYVAVAERFIDTPYLWGGRTSNGIDCSGLVQLALAAAGIAAPRDTDMQAAELFAPVPPGPDGRNLRRGDLLFWKGHVGIISAPGRLLHANGHHMLTVDEPLGAAIARIAATSGPPLGARRAKP